jgi:hypothetical protein
MKCQLMISPSLALGPYPVERTMLDRCSQYKAVGWVLWDDCPVMDDCKLS